MSQPKSLRKELKDQVREEIRQRDDDYIKKVDDIRDAFLNNDISSHMNDLEKTFMENVRIAVRQKVADVLAGRLPPYISYEDSDQSPVYGEDAAMLAAETSTGLDYAPSSPHLSDWLRTIYLGDYEGFLGFLRGLSANEVKVLLSKRESLHNRSAVSHVILGAQSQATNDEFLLQWYRQKTKDGHMKILIKLLTLGVDVNVKDVAGRTPLRYCFDGGFNDVTLKMAERLIRAGADVNAQDRFGDTALHVSIFSGYPDLVEFLLDHGADPDIKNNHGESAHDYASPSIKDVLGYYERKKAMEARKVSRSAAGGSFRQCGVCGTGVGEKVMKRCSGCYLYWYCGRQCQLDHWPEHKDDCKKVQLQYKTFYITDKEEKGKNHQSGKIFSRLTGDRPKKSHCVVKVEMETSRDNVGEVKGLKVSTEDYLLFGHIVQEHSLAEVKDIKDKIQKEGHKGVKGFFYAMIPKDGRKKFHGRNVVEIQINTSQIQPIEGW